MEQRSRQTGSGRGHRQGSYSFCCMSVRLELCDNVPQNQKGEIMVFTSKAVGREHILSLIRAEPVMGKIAHCTKNITKKG